MLFRPVHCCFHAFAGLVLAHTDTLLHHSKSAENVIIWFQVELKFLGNSTLSLLYSESWTILHYVVYESTCFLSPLSHVLKTTTCYICVTRQMSFDLHPSCHWNCVGENILKAPGCTENTAAVTLTKQVNVNLNILQKQNRNYPRSNSPPPPPPLRSSAS